MSLMLQILNSFKNTVLSFIFHHCSSTVLHSSKPCLAIHPKDNFLHSFKKGINFRFGQRCKFYLTDLSLIHELCRFPKSLHSSIFCQSHFIFVFCNHSSIWNMIFYETHLPIEAIDQSDYIIIRIDFVPAQVIVLSFVLPIPNTRQDESRDRLQGSQFSPFSATYSVLRALLQISYLAQFAQGSDDIYDSNQIQLFQLFA